MGVVSSAYPNVIQDAPPGTRGISLFLVPKWLVDENGEPIKDQKNVVVSGIEHKMGIKGSSTCVCVFDNSVGWLIGKENKGNVFSLFSLFLSCGTYFRPYGYRLLPSQG